MTIDRNDMRERFGRNEEKLDRIEDSLRRIEKAINGNGQPGLLTRVSILEDRQRRAPVMATKIGGMIAVVTAAVAEATRALIW